MTSDLLVLKVITNDEKPLVFIGGSRLAFFEKMLYGLLLLVLGLFTIA